MAKVAYQVNATVPVDGLAALLHTIKSSGGSLRRMVPVGAERPAYTARQVVMDALRAGEEACRSDLARLLELNGHSPEGIGPVCGLLQREGRIYSPRRGFWRIR